MSNHRFNIGDKVKVIREAAFDSSLEGKIATIVTEHKGLYGLDFGTIDYEEINFLHTLGGTLNRLSGWWIYPSAITHYKMDFNFIEDERFKDLYV